ncbi:MAG TPA: SAM-dependent methyltransferase [Trebonia sp.]|jgi:SAM-dependent methyltransferase|nr:SAM-dependent methyltransferase [Trebonia sp.]
MSSDGSSLGIDTSVPSIARVYDFFLGGKDNFTVDRELAAQIAELSPDWVQACRDNRYFVGRAVTWAAGQGIRQFLDLGAGLPTHPAVHETAQEITPGARVCYVDNDLIVVTHAQALLTKPANVDVARADLSDPASVFGHPRVNSIIDWSQPVCVLLAMVLHFYDPVMARRLAEGYASRLAPGSVLAISCGRNDDPDMWRQMRQNYTAATTYNHTRDELRSFFGALEMVPPGLALARTWRGGMTDVPNRPSGPAYVLAAVGVKR